MAFNMKRKKEVEQANDMAKSLYPGVEYDEITKKELHELERKYIYEEIDAKEYARLGKELAMRELEEAMKERENNNQ
jgi:hypothetical protein